MIPTGGRHARTITQPTQEFSRFVDVVSRVPVLASAASAESSQAPRSGGSGGHRGGTRGDSILRGHTGRRALRTRRTGRVSSSRAAGGRDGNPRAGGLESALPSLALAHHSHGRGPPQRLVGLHFRARGGGARDGCRHRRLPQSPGADPPAGAADQDRVQRADDRQRRLGRPGRADRANRRRFRLAPGKPLAARRQRPPHSRGGGHGRRNCRDLPRPVGGRLVCRRSALLLAGVRTGSDHARGDCQCRFLLHLRALCRLEAALRDPRYFLCESLASWGRTCCWCCS